MSNQEIPAGEKGDMNRKLELKFSDVPGSNTRRDFQKHLIENLHRSESVQKRKDELRAIAIQTEVALSVKGKGGSADDATVLNSDELLLYQDVARSSISEASRLSTSSDFSEAKESNDQARDLHDILFQPKVFGAHYARWASEYEKGRSEEKFLKQFPTLESYITAKGKEFIAARQKDITTARIQNLALFDGAEESEKAKKQQEMAKKTMEFLEKNKADLLEYSSLADGKPEKKKFYQKFLKELNLQQTGDPEMKKLLQGLAEDALSEYTAELKFEATFKIMMEMFHDMRDMHMEISQQDWGETVAYAVRKNATGLLQEGLETQEEGLANSIYEFQFKFWKYFIIEGETDRAKLKEWKEKIIDKTIVSMGDEMKKPPEERSPEFRAALGDNPTFQDVILYAVSRFILDKRSKPFSKMAVLGKMTGSVPARVSDLGQESDNCILTSAVAMELARMYGIEGEITREPGGTDHHYWQEIKADGTRGSIIDTYWGKPRKGFVKNPKSWGKVVREDYSQDGLPESMDWYYLGRELPKDEQ